MTPLAALVLGSSLTALAAGTETPSPEQPAVVPTHRSERSRQTERSRERRAAFNIVGGIGLLAGSSLFYVMTGSIISRDLKLTSAGCAAPNNPCYVGTPVVLLIPLGASAMGGLAAVRLAAAREANLWRSPMFWAGTAVQVAAYVAWGLSSNQTTRNQLLAWDTTFVAGAVLSTTMQVWGALIAPPRHAEPLSPSLSLAPGCGPTAGGVVCGLALAGF